ncbi:unnamed protein product [Didymodactylos carnosus]|uniref:Uncharacterized protein n=1 Tax=Didymodactylos carnosus TaxID=1234261 RepID=A0A8S2G7G9_9BILA|nr:unnamed protein product [Didymodactylos carnosus]CAF4452653.1 unnamed protein product [Didymodactylos carnosus]
MTPFIPLMDATTQEVARPPDNANSGSSPSTEQNPSIVSSQANIRGLFYGRLNMEKKAKNTQSITIHRYDEIISKLKGFKTGVKRSTPDDYNIYGRFELYMVENVEQLMKKRRPDEQDIKILVHDHLKNMFK